MGAETQGKAEPNDSPKRNGERNPILVGSARPSRAARLFVRFPGRHFYDYSPSFIIHQSSSQLRSSPLQGMDFRLMVQGFSLSPSFSTISTTTSLHVFQVGRQDSMNLMPLHRPSRFGPRSNRCKHEFQRVRRLPTIGELTTRTKKDKHYPLSPESCRVPRTEDNN